MSEGGFSFLPSSHVLEVYEGSKPSRKSESECSESVEGHDIGNARIYFSWHRGILYGFSYSQLGLTSKEIEVGLNFPVFRI